MKQYIIEAFADKLYQGNPAAICFPERWPSLEEMMAITRENNLAETSFAVKEDDGWHLRWFSQKNEVDLCGHATLAAADAVCRFMEPGAEEVTFHTMSGPLTVCRRGELYELDFPAYTLKKLEVTDAIADALGARPREVWRARDLLCIFDDPKVIEEMHPDLDKLRGLKGALMQVTAPGGDTGYDCVSRTFGPKVGMDEDPVCGSGHCHIIPYWAAQTGKTEFTARQASPRGGTLYCRLEGDRVFLAGRAILYAQCELMTEGERA